MAGGHAAIGRHRAEAGRHARARGDGAWFSPVDLAGMLYELNRLGFGYRWVTRFLRMDKAEAERQLTRLRRQWFAKRKAW